MSKQIRIRRGLNSNLPAATSGTLGELRYSTDTRQLYIDDGSENVELTPNITNISTGGGALSSELTTVSGVLQTQIDLLSDYYVVDSAESDQGITASGTGYTIYDVVQLVGTSKNATIKLRHNPADGNTTTYTFDTSLDLTNYPNVYFYFEPGAVVERLTGDEVFTVYSAANITAGNDQLISSDAVLDFYSSEGSVWLGWYGSDATAFANAYAAVDVRGTLRAVEKAWTFSSAITINAENKNVIFEGDGYIYYTGTGTAVIISGTHQSQIQVGVVRSSDSWSADQIGIKISNVYMGDFYFYRIEGFRNAIYLDADSDSAVRKNKFRIGNIYNNKIGIYGLRTSGSGYVIENSFYGEGGIIAVGSAHNGDDRIGVEFNGSNLNFNKFYNLLVEIDNSDATSTSTAFNFANGAKWNFSYNGYYEGVDIILEADSTSQHNYVEGAYSNQTAGKIEDYINDAGMNEFSWSMLPPPKTGLKEVFSNSDFYQKTIVNNRVSNEAYGVVYPGFVWLKSSGNYALSDTDTRIHTDGIKLSIPLGRIVDTSYVKQFWLSNSITDSSTALYYIRCYDATGVTLGGTSPYYVSIYARDTDEARPVAYDTYYGGVYEVRAEFSEARIKFHDDVKMAFIGLGKYNVGNEFGKHFSVTVPGISPVPGSWLPIGNDPLGGIQEFKLISDASPVGGFISNGDIIWKSSGSSTTPGWVCVDSGNTTASGGEPAGETNIVVDDIGSSASGDIVGMVMDDGYWMWTTINGAPAGNTIVITDAVPAGRAIPDGARIHWFRMEEIGAEIGCTTLSVNGTSDLDGAVVINESGIDVDFRVESNNNANILFVDAGNDRVGIGTNSPGTLLDLYKQDATTGAGIRISSQDTSAGSPPFSFIEFKGSTTNDAGGTWNAGKITGGYTGPGYADSKLILQSVDSGQNYVNSLICRNGNVSLNSGAEVNEFSIDGTFAGNSDTAVPTEKAVKTYVDTHANGTGADHTYINQDVTSSASPAFSGLAVNGDVDLTSSGVNQLLLPENDSPGAPTIKFGSGATGIYSSSTGEIDFAFSGTHRLNIQYSGLYCNGTGNPCIMNEAAAYNNPVFVPYQGDDNDTGIGAADASSISLIAQGTEIARVQSTGVSCSVTATEGNHLTNKTYVDGEVSTLSGSLASDLSTHANGTGADHTYIDQDVTSSASPTFAGIAVNGDSSLNGAVVINESGADKDFRVEGDTNTNLLFVDASADSVGIGTSSPGALLDLYKQHATVGAGIRIRSQDTVAGSPPASYIEFEGSTTGDAGGTWNAGKITGGYTGPGYTDARLILQSVDSGQNYVNSLTCRNGKVSLNSGAEVNEFSTDGALAGDSDTAVPTEKAVKTYVDGKFTSGWSGTIPTISGTITVVNGLITDYS